MKTRKLEKGRMLDKDKAYEFLSGLSNYLNQRLTRPEDIRAQIRTRWKVPTAKKPLEDRLACRENLFLYPFALPLIVSYLEEVEKMDRDSVINSLKGEYYNKFPQFLSGNARRFAGHPLDKKYGKKIADIISDWRKTPGSEPLNRAHPDLCFTGPFPHKIVCDVKFFDDESLSAAEQALVEGVYEVFYYRSLPNNSFKHPQSEWTYDYGCLLAYDASAGSWLRRAWDSIVSKRLFWDDANIYVMICRPD